MNLTLISCTQVSNNDSPETFKRLEPVAITDLQTHGRLPTVLVPPADDPAYIEGLISAAREQVEGYECRIQLLDATYDGYLDSFPCANVIELPKPPLLDVVGVFYIDTDGVEREFTSWTDKLNWTPGVIPSELPAPGYILLDYEESWPSTRCQPDAVRIRFRCGFGDEAADVPRAIKQWIMIAAGTMYEHREKEISGTIISRFEFIGGLLDPWRARRIVA